jgi:hypothetical protein
MKISNFLWDLSFPNPLKRGWSLNVFLVQFVKLAWCLCFVFPRYRSIHLFVVDSSVFVWEVPPITEALKMLAPEVSQVAQGQPSSRPLRFYLCYAVHANWSIYHHKQECSYCKPCWNQSHKIKIEMVRLIPLNGLITFHMKIVVISPYKS